jgi:hypothetical protein
MKPESFSIGPDGIDEDCPVYFLPCHWCGHTGKPGRHWQAEVVPRGQAVNGPELTIGFQMIVWCGECPKIQAPRDN